MRLCKILGIAIWPGTRTLIDKPICVGGIHPDNAKIVWSEDLGFPDLDPALLADVCVCSVMKRLDCKGHIFQIQQTPRKRVTSKEDEFLEFGKLIETCMAQNFGHPPAAVSYDNHGSFALVNAALLGIGRAEDAAGVPFFQDCTSSPALQIPMFVCRVLYHKGSCPMFGVNDPLHVQKVALLLVRKCLDVFLPRVSGSNEK